MAYNTNKGYGNNISYNFSARVSDYATNNFNQIGYQNSSPIIHYSANSGINYGSPSNFGYERKSVGTGYTTKSGDSSGRGMGGGSSGRGMGGGRGRGMSRGKGKGIGRSKRQGKEIINKEQRFTDMQNQFIVSKKNKDPLTEINLAIKNLIDSPQNQTITQEFTQLEMVYHKEVTLAKKIISKQEHLEIIIKKVELLSKKYKKNIIK